MGRGLLCLLALSLLLVIGMIGGAKAIGEDPATIRVYPSGVLPAVTPGPWEIIVGSPGSSTATVNVDLKVEQSHLPYHIEFVAAMNNSGSQTPLPVGFSVSISPGPTSSPGGPYFGGPGQSGPQPTYGSPEAYDPSMNPGVGGLGPSNIFPCWYFFYDFAFDNQLTIATHFIQTITVSITIPPAMALPVRIVLLAWGPYSDTIGVETLVGYYATPWSGTTGIRVVPELPVGSIVAVVATTGALLFSGNSWRRKSVT